MKLYKLTDSDGCTRGGMQWGPGVTHEATGAEDQLLCTDGWIHVYEHPLLAALLYAIHVDFQYPRLWEAEGEIGRRQRQLKAGCRKLTTVREIPVPEITLDQRVRFAIACAWPLAEAEWRDWAFLWLGGADRTEESAWAASDAASRAAWAASKTAAWAAAAASGGYTIAYVATAESAASTAETAGYVDLLACAEWAVTDAGIDALYPTKQAGGLE